jgi:ubiquinone/menaquinone biosynthesis C-methylase UbiE
MLNNHTIFNECHTGKNLTHDVTSKYDKHFILIKSLLLKKYVKNGDKVLDLCCGAGDYLPYVLHSDVTYFGVDFSKNMLSEFKNKLNNESNILLINSNVYKLPIANNVIDVCFCYSSIYYLERIDDILSEINRILSNNGVVILEFATKGNINAFVSEYWAKNNSWGIPFFISYKDILKNIHNGKFKIIEERHFQLFPVLRGPWWLIVLASGVFRPLLRLKIAGISLDERISSISFLKKYSFKYFAILKRK